MGGIDFFSSSRYWRRIGSEFGHHASQFECDDLWFWRIGNGLDDENEWIFHPDDFQ